MTIVQISSMPEGDLPAHIERMNAEMREYTARAARGECSWICSDCCMSESNGMPDKCIIGCERCTAIIKRDKREAMREGNEPS